MSLGSGWCFGGPTVKDRDANASVVVRTFQVPPGSKVEEKLDPAALQALMAYAADGTTKIDLTGTVSAAGDVDWIAPAISTNPWTVYAISQKPSGQKVKRPGPGGEGWMLNPAYAQAVYDWLPWFDHALANYSGSKPEAVFQDSYEYRTDWAPDFFDQFEDLRGYRLQNELPTLFGDAPDDHTARVKYDYRRTLSDIMAQQSEPAWIDWAHRNGFSTIYQAHGTPANWLDLYGDADMPETEMFHDDRSILVSKFASSAAHTQGHALTGAETGTWLKEHFTETLADVKYLADDMFLAGVNHIYYHGACYSPDDAAWPGWLFYASTEMNPRNPIWHDVGTVNEYIARCQSILQAGQPDNDVLLYWPVADFWSEPSGRVQPMAVGKTEWLEDQPIGRTAHELWNQGYGFDFVSDAQLLKAKMADGKIRMPGGAYQVIVVPECKYMPFETFTNLIALEKAGARIIFGNPTCNASGWGNFRAQTDEMARHWQTDLAWNKLPPGGGTLADKNALGVARNTNGAGEILLPEGPEALCQFALPFVGVTNETMAARGLSLIRRSGAGGWNYFIANRTGTNFDGWVALARPARSFALLDPMTGAAGAAATRKSGPNSREIHLQLQAGQSVIVRAFTNGKLSLPASTYWHPNGQPVEITAPGR